MATDRREFSRADILDRLRATAASGQAIVAAGCSNGIVAKSAEAAGADLIIVYSTGLSRLMGLPTSLYLGHSNTVTQTMYAELANVVDSTPIIGGGEATDPTYRRLSQLIREFRATGFDGIINFPTIGDRPGYSKMRSEVGLGFDREVEMIRIAREQDIFTMAYVYSTEHARQMAAAGVDVQVAHVGWTAGGDVGAGTTTMTIDDGCKRAQEIIDVTLKENPECLCLAHGGPFGTPAEIEYLYQRTDALGFVGASSIERIPVERAVIDVVAALKRQKVRSQ